MTEEDVRFARRLKEDIDIEEERRGGNERYRICMFIGGIAAFALVFIVFYRVHTYKAPVDGDDRIIVPDGTAQVTVDAEVDRVTSQKKKTLLESDTMKDVDPEALQWFLEQEAAKKEE